MKLNRETAHLPKYNYFYLNIRKFRFIWIVICQKSFNFRLNILNVGSLILFYLAHQRENRILSTKHSTSGERFSNPGLGSTKSHQRSQRILFESKPSYSLHQDNTVESFDIVNSKNQNSYESLSRTLNSRPSEKKVPFIKFNSNFLGKLVNFNFIFR